MYGYEQQMRSRGLSIVFQVHGRNFEFGRVHARGAALHSQSTYKYPGRIPFQGPARACQS
jgi:hypothetical protein